MPAIPAIVGAVLSALGSGVSTIASFIGRTFISGIRAVVGGIVGAIRTVISYVFNAIRSGLTFIFNGLKDGILGGFGMIVKGVHTLAKALTVGFAAAIGGVVALVVKASQELGGLAKSINALRGSTGMSAGAAGSLISAYGAHGIKSDTVASMFENSNPISNAIRSRMMGGRDMSDIVGMAGRFQSMSRTPFGNRIARGFLGDMDTPEMRNVLMRPVSMLRDESNFARTRQQGMGLNPSIIAAVGQALESVTNKFEILKSTTLIKIASEVLPYLISKFDQLANWITGNSSTIAETIKKGAQAFIGGAEAVFGWLSENGPGMWNWAVTAFTTVYDFLATNGPAIGEMITGAAKAGWSALLKLAEFIYADLPDMILGGLSYVLHGIESFATGISNYLMAFSKGNTALNSIISGVLDGVDSLLGIGVVVGNALKGIYNINVWFWNLFTRHIVSSVYAMVHGIADILVHGPGGTLIDWLIKRLGGPSIKDAVDDTRAFIAPKALPYATMSDPDESLSVFRNWRHRFEVGMKKGAADASGMVGEFASYVGGKANALDKYRESLSSPAERHKQFADFVNKFDAKEKDKPKDEKQIAWLSTISKQLTNIEKNTGATADNMMDFGERVAGRAVSYMVQDEAMNMMRV